MPPSSQEVRSPAIPGRFNFHVPKRAGWSRGFAFVEFMSVAEAEKAMAKLHGSEFKGYKLVARPAKPRGV